MCFCIELTYKLLGSVSNAFKRKYIQRVLKRLNLDNEAEVAIELIDELRVLYEKKLEPYVDKYGADVDAYFKKKIEELDIDLDKLKKVVRKVEDKIEDEEKLSFEYKLETIEEKEEL